MAKFYCDECGFGIAQGSIHKGKRGCAKCRKMKFKVIKEWKKEE